ncbi:MAG: response regulator [Methylococcales bacterium]
MKILIAEDSQIFQVLYRELIQGWGFNCDIAENGLEAVRLAQENKGKYALCIMDIIMPNMNGFEATKVIRKTVGFFPIILETVSNCFF